jgi:hypothetical protein
MEVPQHSHLNVYTHDTRLRPTKCGPAAGYPVVRVVQAFQPEIWDDTQVSVVKGDLFLRLWQQPTEDARCTLSCWDDQVASAETPTWK